MADLGTEFGVEVDKQGCTTSHVFRGVVRVQVAGSDGKAEGATQLLHENESARVDNGNRNRVIVVGSSMKPANFVREVPKRTMKTLDLVDVVAGGDGFSGRRDRWIDPSSGRVSDTPAKETKAEKDYLVGDGKYHRVEGLPFVDGVFIPDGRLGPVQVDSAGHAFSDFPNTSHQTDGYIWAGGAASRRAPLRQYDKTRRRRLWFVRPRPPVPAGQRRNHLRFGRDPAGEPRLQVGAIRAAAGNTEPVSAEPKWDWVTADLFVLVDGQVRFRRMGINGRHGAYSVAVPIGENDRFLTLASTDGGNGIAWDWIMFGDPRLELLPAEPGSKATTRKLK